MLFTCVGLALLWWTVVWLLRQLKIGRYGDRHVFITGCDTGFGNLLARQLDEMGFHVFAGCLTDEGQEELKNCCSSRLVTIEIDVTKDDSIQSAVDAVTAGLTDDKGLWAVVNNAGIIGSIGKLSWLTREDFERTLAVNLYGVIFVTKAFLPLVRRARGRVVNMSSVLGRVGYLDPTYSVSKFGVEAFSDYLRREQYAEGVSVHILEPGFFATSLFSDSGMRKLVEEKLDSLPPEITSDLPDDTKESIMKSLEGIKKIACKDLSLVVDAYVHAITARFPKRRYIIGKDAKFLLAFLSVVPHGVSDFVLHRMSAKKK